MLPDVCTRAEVGRITGRGNTANLESVIALKPDLILDVGSTSATFVSLAERVQQQTNIPYALLDGRFDAVAETYRKLGELTGRQVDAEKLARYADDTIKTTVGRIAAIAPSSCPAVDFARGPRGLVTGLGGSINVETIEMLAQNVAGGNQGGLANVSIEQVLLWNPDIIITIDQDFAASVRSDPAWSSVKAVRDGRVHLSPKMPFGWLYFPPSGEPADRLALAGKDPVPGQISGGYSRANPGILCDVLSSHSERRADRPCAGRERLVDPLRPAGPRDRNRCADRGIAACLHNRPLSGIAGRVRQRTAR